jgi:hypothetical protein
VFAQPLTETSIAGAQEKRPSARRIGIRSTLRRPL